jgi:hypothetical protein
MWDQPESRVKVEIIGEFNRLEFPMMRISGSSSIEGQTRCLTGILLFGLGDCTNGNTPQILNIMVA